MFREVILPVIGICVIGSVIVILFGVAIIAPLNMYECNKLGENINKYTEWHFWGAGESGCLVETEQGLVPKEVWINNTGN